MSNIDELISNIDSRRRNPKNNELWDFIKASLEQIKEINDDYKKLYEGADERPAIIQDIENKYEKIKTNFDDLFLVDETGKNKSQKLDEKIEEIKSYHQELLVSSDGTESIKSDIEDSRRHITDFYNFLFGDEEGQDNADKTKKSIEDINQFHAKLFEKENGLEQAINKAYESITKKYSYLFDKEGDEKSRAEELDENIKNINSFNKSLDEKVKPNLVQKEEYIDKVQTDIETKRKDIQSLLSSATLGALTQGYQESKEEYSGKNKIQYKSSGRAYGRLLNLPYNVFVFIYNTFFRFNASVLNYFIFIMPLIIICGIFLEPKFLEGIFNFKVLYGEGDNRLKGWEFVFLKVSISLPLLWVSWFGQQNLSKRKRLFEEYNHKLRVVQMYRMFNDNTASYNLDNKIKLERILLDVIEKNPAEYLGKGETMIDQILEKFRIKGFYKELKEEIIGELRPIITTSVLKQERNILEKIESQDKLD